MIATAANCADPAKTIADMTIVASGEKPMSTASTPNDSDRTTATTPNGMPARRPA
jgi:hypothetical protein